MIGHATFRVAVVVNNASARLRRMPGTVEEASIPLIAEMPHGGFEESGYGKDLSAYSLEDYTRIKHVMSAVGGA